MKLRIIVEFQIRVEEHSPRRSWCQIQESSTVAELQDAQARNPTELKHTSVVIHES